MVALKFGFIKLPVKDFVIRLLLNCLIKPNLHKKYAASKFKSTSTQLAFLWILWFPSSVKEGSLLEDEANINECHF